MPTRDITRTRSNIPYILPPIFIMLILWALGILHWFIFRDPIMLILFGYLGVLSGAGIGGYIAAADRYRPYARRLVILLLGSLLLIVALLTDHGNMQIEGVFFALMAGGGSYILLHYAIAKFVGPLVFGRIWCGWACWYAMIFDLLPYPFSHYRRPAKWGYLRYIHLIILLGLAVVLWYGFKIDGANGLQGMTWFVIGIFSYYIVGIIMAIVLQDNRAFCKYLCPIAVPLKFTSQFSLLRVSGEPSHCNDCEVCVEMCPMDVHVKDYIQIGERVLSTECTLCLTCISACPHDALKLSVAFDKGGKDYTDFDDSPGNRNTRLSNQAQ